MKCSIAFLLFLLFALHCYVSCEAYESVSEATVKYEDPCKDIPECANDSMMICGCRDERCKYFGGECHMNRYNECHSESELKII